MPGKIYGTPDICSRVRGTPTPDTLYASITSLNGLRLTLKAHRGHFTHGTNSGGCVVTYKRTVLVMQPLVTQSLSPGYRLPCLLKNTRSTPV